jgi:hypothetical protein
MRVSLVRTKHALAAAAALLTFVSVPALAQRKLETFGPASWSMNPEYRQVQHQALDVQRKLLLSMADSMPERLYRDKATPAQRDFAQQLQHAVGSSLFISSFYIATDSTVRPPRADTAAVFNTRAGMRAYINAGYDYLTGLLDKATETDRNTVVLLFDGKKYPRWQLWDELNQHAMWTAGQVVANFRKQGMAPPPFLFF